MAEDRFKSIRGLADAYVRGKDFDITTRMGSTHPGVLIMAPHGGKIELALPKLPMPRRGRIIPVTCLKPNCPQTTK
jgi:phage replication-related protein YjqB (UPF0714/DUF867 family)